ncbi:MAG TPA: fibronectin type III domain-containing protein [Terriglobales bacterium]|nr:fibronectin type III domain-containing protein [Terriglobales bacterium]
MHFLTLILLLFRMKAHLGKLIAPAVLCLLLAGCAQNGPPLPPSLELSKPPMDLRASRKGNRITLSWSEPTLTTDRQSVRYIGPTLVCLSLEYEITECGSPAAVLPAPSAAAPKPDAAHPALQTYTGALPSAMQPLDPAAEVTYAVEVLNRNARGAGLSNRVHVSAVATLPPPADLAAELTGDGVVLTWTSAGELQTVPNIQYRYRVYRRDESSGKDAIAGEVPIPTPEPRPAHFTDSTFEWEKTYFYRITAVTIIKRPDSEVQVEGDDTAPLRVIAHDVFPPSVPTGLQAAYSGEGQKPFIDLIWAPVTNADLAGYNIYRSEQNGAPIKLNSDLVKSPSYRDSAVASGKTYTYSVSAVDVRGNESQRSEETGEPVP